MEKPKIKEISSKEYEFGRIDNFVLSGNQDLHKELISFLVDIGISEKKVEEFDFITSENEGNFFIFDGEKRIHLIVSEDKISFLLDTKIPKDEMIKKIEKYFQIF